MLDNVINISLWLQAKHYTISLQKQQNGYARHT